MKTNPRRSRELCSQAQTLLQGRRIDEALAKAEEARRLDPKNPDAWFVMAAAHAQRHDYRRTAQCCDEVLRHSPDNLTARYNLGLARQSMGDTDGAAQAYRDVLKQQRHHPAATINLATLLLDTGQTDEALRLVDALLASAPNLGEARIVKGLVLLKQGQAQAAREWFEAELKRQGETPQILYHMARCLRALGETQAAEAQLDTLTQRAPGFAPAWEELGHIARHKEDFNQAAHYYQQAAQVHPSVQNRFNLAHCLYASDRFDPACKLYTDLLQERPDDPLIHNNLGRLYERIGQILNAERHFRRAVELQPERAVPHCNLGRILLGLGQLEAARQEYAAAIERDSEYFEGYYGLGQVFCELGDTQAAIDAFRQAVARKADLTDAKYYIASLGGQDADETDKQSYVAGLFDKYANKFDDELVNKLQYRTPDVLYKALRPLLGETRSLSILDLGCGTGLCGPLFKPHAERLVGVDLSPQMVEKAHARGYDELAVDDVTAFMQKRSTAYDLILAADVFVYIGDLSDVFKTAAARLAGLKLFAFSTETCEGEGFKIRSSGRHAHSKAYILKLAQAHGLELNSQADCDLRLEYGKPVKGTIYVLNKTAD